MKKQVFIREEQRSGVGRVIIFSDREVIAKPTPTYINCAKLINAIWKEKARAPKPKLIDYVA